jgi:Flp pilus assembly protein CpaB
MDAERTLAPPLPPDRLGMVVMAAIVTLSLLITVGLSLARTPQLADIAVPRSDIPAYHLISPGDLMTKTVALHELPASALVTQTELVGRFSLSALKANHPVSSSHTLAVSATYDLDSSFVVAVSVSSSMALAGAIKPGERIDLHTVSALTTTQNPPLTVVGEDVLVLDVKGASPSSAMPVPGAMTLVVALPQAERDAALLASAQGRLLVSRPARR